MSPHGLKPWPTLFSSATRITRSYSTRRVMARDYSAAVAALNTLQSNFAIVDAIRKSGRGMNQQAIPEMIEWCQRAGYEPSDFNRLKPIHMSGTKGKGSTSAFISSILGQYLPETTPSSPIHKVGLYTSPHLRSVRERIQINHEPISEDMFAKYFFEIWDRLEESTKTKPIPSDHPQKPVYFRYLTLMALHAYVNEGVNTAVMECGIGGEYDSTNILLSPTVAAVTSLGIDHVAMLGNTIEEIAWHKAGIFKRGAAAFTVPQPEAVITVLKKRAADVGAELQIIERHADLENINLGLAADFQKTNASLAITVAAAHLRALGYNDVPAPEEITKSSLPAKFKTGLEQVKWPGRCEVRRETSPAIAWHIDGGHTLESIELSGRWFAEQIQSVGSSKGKSKRILLFNQQTRDAGALARALHKTLATALGDEKPFTHAVFCSNVTFKDGGYKPDLVSMNTNKEDVDALAVQKGLARTWEQVDAETEVKVSKTIEEAVEWCREVAREGEEQGEVMVLITGSLHLVGGALEVLESGKKE
ncbi:putative tetrahydrofolylpolyglutamate synthase [Aulographum hederae CBS 113979]|uniref:Folylpolyglutamate synthase n=1 Tax=Aulographum hederae CBS 113979 TaxID=1176131 RepID=A0A6G1GNS0_9PEZI|nr:putative tetrahydrofolylpolyglutamate synthase [Aulographum hederae CBS 113979]